MTAPRWRRGRAPRRGGASPPLRPGHRAPHRRRRSQTHEEEVADFNRGRHVVAAEAILGVSWSTHSSAPSARPSALRCDGSALREGAGVRHRCVPQQRVPPCLGNTARLAVMTVPVGWRSVSAWRARRQADPRCGFFRTVFSSTVAPALPWRAGVVLRAARSRSAADLLHGIIPSMKNPGLCATGHGAPAVALSSIWASPGSHLSSSRQRCRASERVVREALRRRCRRLDALHQRHPAHARPTILFTIGGDHHARLQHTARVALLTGGGPDPERRPRQCRTFIYGRNSL